MCIRDRITDEHFLILRVSGFKGEKGIKDFKSITLLEILSSSYKDFDEIYDKTNYESRKIALEMNKDLSKKETFNLKEKYYEQA